MDKNAEFNLLNRKMILISNDPSDLKFYRNNPISGVRYPHSSRRSSSRQNLVLHLTSASGVIEATGASSASCFGYSGRWLSVRAWYRDLSRSVVCAVAIAKLANFWIVPFHSGSHFISLLAVVRPVYTRIVVCHHTIHRLVAPFSISPIATSLGRNVSHFRNLGFSVRCGSVTLKKFSSMHSARCWYDSFLPPHPRR